MLARISLDIFLLAINCWHECRSEPVPGMIAVSQVLINRSELCGTTIKRELFRPSQFSWVNGSGKLLLRLNKDDDTSFSKCLATAYFAYMSPDLTSGSLYYHSVNVTPRWVSSMSRTMSIGGHVFYSGEYGCLPVGQDDATPKTVNITMSLGDGKGSASGNEKDNTIISIVSDAISAYVDIFSKSKKAGEEKKEEKTKQ